MKHSNLKHRIERTHNKFTLCLGSDEDFKAVSLANQISIMKRLDEMDG